jgi:prophage regulatory protein
MNGDHPNGVGGSVPVANASLGESEEAKAWHDQQDQFGLTARIGANRLRRIVPKWHTAVWKRPTPSNGVPAFFLFPARHRFAPPAGFLFLGGPIMETPHPDREGVRLVPQLEGAAVCALRSKAEMQRAQRKGVFVKGVRLGHRTTVVAQHEVDAIARARLRGASDDELRALVDELHARRQELSR